MHRVRVVTGGPIGTRSGTRSSLLRSERSSYLASLDVHVHVHVSDARALAMDVHMTPQDAGMARSFWLILSAH